MKKVKGILMILSALLLSYTVIYADNLYRNDVISDGQQTSNDSYQQLLNHSINRGYINNYRIDCNSNDYIEIKTSIVYDDQVYEAPLYILLYSPYRIEQIKNGDSSLDTSKIIMKHVIRSSNGTSVSFSLDSSDLQANTDYYGVIIPINDYDEIGLPSQEIHFNISKNICEYNNRDAIILKPGLNTFSTPAILNSISFSNGGSNISFAKMVKGIWTPITVNNSNIETTVKPLEGYIVRNSNAEDVIITLEYDSDNSNSLILSKELDAGWNFLGITTTDNPFANIASAITTMKLDLTNGLITNLIQIGKTFKNATNYMLGKAYAVFVNNSGTYGGVNNYGNNDTNDDDDGNHNISYSAELAEAYNRAFENGIISESPIDNADLYGSLTNLSMEIILLNYAKYLGLDINSTGELIGNLFDNLGASANLANFGTALSRILWGSKYDGGDPYYQNHLGALQTAGIITQINNPETTKEIKGYVLLTLMRAAEYYVDCDEPIIAAACLLGDDSCPEICRPSAVLTNNLTKTVEYPANEVSRYTVFDGIYTAVKDHTIKGYSIGSNVVNYEENCYNDITFNLYVNGELVGSSLNPSSNNIILNSCQYFGSLSFNNIINLNEGDSLQIKVEGELNSAIFNHTDKEDSYNYELTFYGEEGESEKLASANLAQINIVERSSSDVSVYVTKQENEGDYTRYTLGIDKSDESDNVYNVSLFNTSDCSGAPFNSDGQKSIGDGGVLYEDGDEIEIDNGSEVELINSISYVYGSTYKYVCISKDEDPDYFKIGTDYLRVFATK